MNNVVYYLTLISNLLIITVDILFILFGINFWANQNKIKEDIENIKKEVESWTKKKS